MKQKGKSQLNGFLDVGSHLRGDLLFEDTFRVDGRVTGRVESEGDLFVGERGVVDGEVAVRRLFVSGKVAAKVEATERIEVAPGGELRGEVITPCLVLEEGAFFEGVSKMVERPPAVPAKVASLRRGRDGG